MHRRFVLPLLLLLAIATSAAAATRTYDAEAAPVPQIDSITVANTWAAADTATVTVGNAALTVTMGSTTTTTAQVADAIKRAINATEIDQNLVGDESRNAAGQKLGEFRDVEAVIDPLNSSRVLVRSVTPGVPFGTPSAGNMTATEVTAGSGTVTRASVQSATGPWHWNNAVNWSANTAPVNDDTAVFIDTVHGPKYGLPNATTEITIQVHKSFTGWIGLPFKNANGYSEYRERYARFNDAGAGTDILHRIGLGDGPGSPLINLRQTAVKANIVVYGTGKPLTPETYALNVVSAAADSELTVLDGSVNAGIQDSTSPAWENFRVGTNQSTSADCNVLYSGGETHFFVNSGTLLIVNNTGTNDINIYGGTVRVQNSTGTWVHTRMYGPSTLVWESANDPGPMAMYRGAIADFGADSRAMAVTSLVVSGPCTVRDPQQRVTWGEIDMQGTRFTEFDFDYGSQFDFTPSP